MPITDESVSRLKLIKLSLCIFSLPFVIYLPHTSVTWPLAYMEFDRMYLGHGVLFSCVLTSVRSRKRLHSCYHTCNVLAAEKRVWKRHT